MNNELGYLDDDELQAELDRRKVVKELQEGLIVINRDDIESEMWNATWEVCFNGGVRYRAAADCESDALDEVIDWLEENDEETLGDLVIDTDSFAAISEKESQNIEFAGNHSYPLHPDVEIWIMLVKRHKHSYGYY